MAHPLKHVRHQGRVARALGRVAVAAVKQQLTSKEAAPLQVPGPVLSEEVPPRDPELVADYVRWAGGDPDTYGETLPPHLFSQWGFPLLGQTLTGIPYPLAKILNAGCKLELNGPLPANETLYLTAQLLDVDDNGRRVLLHQRLTTSTRDHEDLLVAHVYGLIPLAGGKDKQKEKKKKEKPQVPMDARLLERLELGPRAGLEYACLSGDFNPVHWLWPYARVSGFKSTILHGFATMAKAMETMNRKLLDDDPWRLKEIEVRFTRPLQLPRKIAICVKDDQLSVGDDLGKPAYLTGTFEVRDA